MAASFFGDFPVSPEDAQTIQAIIDQLNALAAEVAADTLEVEQALADIQQIETDLNALIATIPESGLSVWKAPVRLATSAAVDVSSAPAVFDGVNASLDDRILLIDQPVQANNGLWVYKGASIALERPVDADTADKRGPGIFVFVTEGTTNAETLFRAVGTTDALTFAAFAGSAAVTPTGPRYFDIAGFLQGVAPTETTVFSFSPSRAVTIPAAFAGSFANAVTDPSGLIALDVNLEGTKIADLILEASGSSFFQAVDDSVTHSVAAGETITLTTPDNLRNAADISFTIATTLD